MTCKANIFSFLAKLFFDSKNEDKKLGQKTKTIKPTRSKNEVNQTKGIQLNQNIDNIVDKLIKGFNELSVLYEKGDISAIFKEHKKYYNRYKHFCILQEKTPQDCFLICGEIYHGFANPKRHKDFTYMVDLKCNYFVASHIVFENLFSSSVDAKFSIISAFFTVMVSV